MPFLKFLRSGNVLTEAFSRLRHLLEVGCGRRARDDGRREEVRRRRPLCRQFVEELEVVVQPVARDGVPVRSAERIWRGRSNDQGRDGGALVDRGRRAATAEPHGPAAERDRSWGPGQVESAAPLQLTEVVKMGQTLQGAV